MHRGSRHQRRRQGSPPGHGHPRHRLRTGGRPVRDGIARAVAEEGTALPRARQSSVRSLPPVRFARGPAGRNARALEKYFRRTLDEVWEETRAFYARYRPEELERAERTPKARMALVFRWYFVQTNRLAQAAAHSRTSTTRFTAGRLSALQPLGQGHEPGELAEPSCGRDRRSPDDRGGPGSQPPHSPP